MTCLKGIIKFHQYDENFIKNRQKTLTKVNSLREEFEKKRREVITDLKEAQEIWVM